MPKKVSKGFIERITVHKGDFTVTPAPESERPVDASHVGIDHEPTDEEIDKMAKALFDSIATKRARKARSQENS